MADIEFCGALGQRYRDVVNLFKQDKKEKYDIGIVIETRTLAVLKVRNGLRQGRPTFKRRKSKISRSPLYGVVRAFSSFLGRTPVLARDSHDELESERGHSKQAANISLKKLTKKQTCSAGMFAELCPSSLELFAGNRGRRGPGTTECTALQRLKRLANIAFLRKLDASRM